MARAQTVAGIAIGALALLGVEVVGQRVLRRRVSVQQDLVMTELNSRFSTAMALRAQGGEAAKLADILESLEARGIPFDAADYITPAHEDDQERPPAPTADDIMDRLQAYGIILDDDEVEDILRRVKAGHVLEAPNSHDLNYTFVERMQLIMRPRRKDRTSLKTLWALERLLQVVADESDMAGLTLGISTDPAKRRRRKKK